VLQIDRRARLLIAGQAPGRRVHESGVPFADASGRRLREWMQVDEATFYDATRVAILPMGFCYPGTGRSGDLPPRPECAEAWRARLLALLPAVELTLVVGRHALEWHLGHEALAPRAGAARSSRTPTLTDAVRDWRAGWPDRLVLPHPSPRNTPWLRRNPVFEREVLPALRARLRALGLAASPPGPA
jgi:uracil-DNA glycosylase